MEKTRRQFTPQQKVAILREHLVEQVPVSDLCDEDCRGGSSPNLESISNRG
jgi:hypothetical protein